MRYIIKLTINVRKEVIKMIYENVEKIRFAKGITKTFIANKANISLQVYHNISKGYTSLDVERLKKIAVALDVNPAIFFDDELTDNVIKRI